MLARFFHKAFSELPWPLRLAKLETVLRTYTTGCYVLPLDTDPKCLQFIIECPCGGRSQILILFYDPELGDCSEERFQDVSSNVTLLVPNFFEEEQSMTGRCLTCGKELVSRIRFLPPV